MEKIGKMVKNTKNTNNNNILTLANNNRMAVDSAEKIFPIICLLCLAINLVEVEEVNPNTVDKIFRHKYKSI